MTRKQLQTSVNRGHIGGQCELSFVERWSSPRRYYCVPISEGPILEVLLPYMVRKFENVL